MTPAPTSATTPAPSWPRTTGNFATGLRPASTWRSDPQTPEAAMRTRTSPGAEPRCRHLRAAPAHHRPELPKPSSDAFLIHRSREPPAAAMTAADPRRSRHQTPPRQARRRRGPDHRRTRRSCPAAADPSCSASRTVSTTYGASKSRQESVAGHDPAGDGSRAGRRLPTPTSKEAQRLQIARGRPAPGPAGRAALQDELVPGQRLPPRQRIAVGHQVSLRSSTAEVVPAT